MNGHIYRNIFAGLFAGILLIAGIGLFYDLMSDGKALTGLNAFPRFTKQANFQMKSYQAYSTGLTDLKIETNTQLAKANMGKVVLSDPAELTYNSYNNVRSGVPNVTEKSRYSVYTSFSQNEQSVTSKTKEHTFRMNAAEVGIKAQTFQGLNSANRKLNTPNGILAMASPAFSASDLSENAVMQKVMPGTGGDATFEELAPVPDGTLFLLLIVLFYVMFRYNIHNQIYRLFVKP